MALGDFSGSNLYDLSSASYLYELYISADPAFTGRATVPVLWEKERRTTINNESADILRMLNSASGTLTGNKLDL